MNCIYIIFSWVICYPIIIIWILIYDGQNTLLEKNAVSLSYSLKHEILIAIITLLGDMSITYTLSYIEKILITPNRTEFIVLVLRINLFALLINPVC